MARKRLPNERTKYHTPVSREDIDRSNFCNMNDCMAYHGLQYDLPQMFPADADVRSISATPTGFNFVYNHTGKVWRAVCIFGTRTAKRIFRGDEIYLRTKSQERARAATKPFTAEWWVEEIKEVRSVPMSKETKERLANSDYERGARANRGRRAFSFAKKK